MKTTFRPRKGIAIDPSPSEVSADYWNDANDYRFRNGRAEVVKGQVELDNYNAGEDVLHLIYTPADADLNNPSTYPNDLIIAATQDDILVTSVFQGSWGNKTPATGWAVNKLPAAGEVLADRFSSARLNGIPFIHSSANSTGLPFYWTRDTQGGDLFVDYKAGQNFPAVSKVVGGIAAAKYHLFAFNLTGLNTSNENTVLWSDAAEPRSVPTFIPQPSNEAGSVDLADTPGGVVDGLYVNDLMWLAKRNALYTAQYVGGQSVFAFRLRHPDIGVASKHCMQAVNGSLFLVTNGDVGLTDGRAFQSVATNRVRDELFTQCSDLRGLFTVHNEQLKEVWIYYPDQTAVDGKANRVLIYNYEVNAWGRADSLPAYHAIIGQYPWTLPVDASEQIDFEHHLVAVEYDADDGNGVTGHLVLADAAENYSKPTGGPVPWLKKFRFPLAEDSQEIRLVTRMGVYGQKAWTGTAPPRVRALAYVRGYETREQEIPVFDDVYTVDLEADTSIAIGPVWGRYFDVELWSAERNADIDGFWLEHEAVGLF